MYKERKKDRELTSIYLDNFFKAKLRAIPKETNKISTLTYKLETMESELKLKKKKEIFDLSKSRQSWHILSSAVSLPTHPVSTTILLPLPPTLNVFNRDMPGFSPHPQEGLSYYFFLSEC